MSLFPALPYKSFSTPSSLSHWNKPCVSVSSSGNDSSRSQNLVSLPIFRTKFSSHLHKYSEKMAVTSPNKWPQLEERGALMPSGAKTMEKTPQDRQALKCPRCDSSNTKFCYYNNYSLSQPRHFCKACKRYWTRGGTLRNVPVGGCRKNKRIKRPAVSSAADHPPVLRPPSASPPKLDVAAGHNDIGVLYGLQNAPSDANIAFSRLGSRSVRLDNAYDVQPQLNPMWLNFPSSTRAPVTSCSPDYQGLLNKSQVQDPVTLTSLLPDFSLLGSSTSSITKSLVSPTLNQQKLLMNLKDARIANDFQASLPFEDLHMNTNSGILKEVKTEDQNNVTSNKVHWQVQGENPFETVAADSPFYWNQNVVGAWPDSNNYGSSIAPLI